MRAALVSSAIVFALLAPSLAAAQDSGLAPEAQEKLVGLLRAYEHVPTAEEFKALGDGTAVRDALIRLAQSDDQAPLLRGNACLALAFYPDDTTRRAVEGLLDRPELSDLVLRRAIATMARSFGAAGLSRLAAYLDDERDAVREAAAQGLGDIGTPAALRALRRRLDHETAEAVQTTLRQQITRLEAATAAE
jgi:HEAT repeat protein